MRSGARRGPPWRPYGPEAGFRRPEASPGSLRSAIDELTTRRTPKTDFRPCTSFYPPNAPPPERGQLRAHAEERKTESYLKSVKESRRLKRLKGIYRSRRAGIAG